MNMANDLWAAASPKSKRDVIDELYFEVVSLDP